MRRERELPEVTDRYLNDYFGLFHALPTVLHMDGAGVNGGERMKAVLTKRGVRPSFNTPHSSAQNPAERYIRTITALARTMLQASGRSLRFWGFAVLHANYVRLRMPCDGNPGCKSPWEMEHKTPPQLGHLRPWGQRAANVRGHRL